MSRLIGDFPRGGTVPFLFNTYDPANELVTFGGTPALSVYQQGSTTPITAGITLNVDLGGVTGKHSVAISLSNAAYVPGYFYDCVVTTGTVAGLSRVGSRLFTFGIEAVWNGWAFEGAAQGAGAQQITLASGEITDDNTLLGSRVVILRSTDSTANLQERIIVETTVADDVAILDRAWDVVPDDSVDDIIYRRYPGSLPLTTAEAAAATLAAAATAGGIAANALAINSTVLDGDGAATPWGPA